MIYSFHNTTHETSPVLERSESKAQKQEDIILDHFKQGGEHTPDEVLMACFAETMTPITSIRRGISNLTAAGHLEKTSKQRPGMFGKLTYVWRLKRKPGLQTKIF